MPKRMMSLYRVVSKDSLKSHLVEARAAGHSQGLTLMISYALYNVVAGEQI